MSLRAGYNAPCGASRGCRALPVALKLHISTRVDSISVESPIVGSKDAADAMACAVFGLSLQIEI